MDRVYQGILIDHTRIKHIRLRHMDNTYIALFKGNKIRKTIKNGEWWFSVVDICEALTSSPDAGAYWRKLKQRLIEDGSEVVTFCHGLKLESSDGKKYETDCADTEGIPKIKVYVRDCSPSR